MEEIAIWPDSTWCYVNDIEHYLSFMSDDYRIYQMFDDDQRDLDQIAEDEKQ